MFGKTRKFALTEGIMAGILFGTAAIFIRFLKHVDAFSIVFWRLIIACLALAVVVIVFGRSFHLSMVKKNFKDLVVLSFFLGLHLIFFVSAVKDTTILNATVLVNTTPIFSMFVSSFFFNVRPSRMALTGLTISFIGVCVIAYAEITTTNTNNTAVLSPSLKGDFEALLAAVVEAFYLNYGRKVRSQMSILSTMIPVYLLTAIIVIVLSVPATSNMLAVPNGVEMVLPLVGLGLLPTAIAHTLYFSSLSNLKSFETATMALLEPIGATILGIIFFLEVPGYLFIFGAALILLGILFIVGEKG